MAAPAARAGTSRRAKPRSRRPTTTRARKIVTIQLGLVVALCVLVLAGIVVLGGTLGPFLVVAYAVIGAGLLYHWSRTRLAGEPLNDDDRMLQTMAAGLSIMAVAFALLSALLVSVK